MTKPVEPSAPKVVPTTAEEQRQPFRCKGCGYPVPYADTYCGECICEDDSE